MNRRVASHYLLICTAELYAGERAIVEAARQLLPPLPTEKQEAICRDSRLFHPFPPSPFRPAIAGGNAPTSFVGFASCCVEVDAHGVLLSLTPFGGETESTEWYPGTLVFPGRRNLL